MASIVGISETALQLTTSVLRTPVWLNDSYTHEQFKDQLALATEWC